MSPEVINIVGGLVIAIISVALTFFFTKLLEKKKVVDYRVFSMSLLRFKPDKDRGLVVSVNKCLLTGKEEDKGELVPVTNAHVFQVIVRNIGSDDVTDATVDIRLDNSAKIIQQETNPASQTSYKVSFENEPANALRVFVPYINRRDQFAIRVISTDNINRYCKVNIQGLGIKIRRNSGRWALIQLAAALLIPFLLLGGLYLAFPETGKAIDSSKWAIVVTFLLAFTPFLSVFIYHTKNAPRNINEFGSGGIKVDDWGLWDD